MRIKEIREARGIKQKELAHALGIAANTLSQYETGKREPDLETTKRIAEYFSISVDSLLGEEGIKNTPDREGGREMGDDEIKAAFWGGDKELSPTEVDELWADAKEYIKFKTEQQKKRRL